MQRIVLDEFAPKSVVVNGEGQVLCASGGMERFLGINGGLFQNNVIKLARSGLRVGIRAALSEAVETRRTVKNENLAVNSEKGVNRVRLTVQPMPQLGEASGLFLLVFEDLGLLVERDESAPGRSDDEANALIEHLEYELQSTREDLERTIRDIEAANQELKSSNEELLSMNEELQSANEELETSREEIQTGSDALMRTNNDLENLLASTQVATIFLDEQGNIQRFTPAVTEIYNLIPGDVGRPLSHITHRAISMPPLPAGEAWAEQEIETENGKWFIRRVQPYRNVTGRPQGLVVTFVDVSALKWAQASLQERESRLALALDAGGMGIWQWDLQEDTVRCDERILSLFDLGLKEQPLSSQVLFGQIHPDDIAAMRESLRRAIEGDGSYITEFRIVLEDGSARWLAGRGRVLRDDAGRSLSVHGVNFDVTERKHDEENLQRSENQFRALAESIPQLAWMAEPDGHIFWYNQRWFDYTGTTLESMKGWGWQSVHDPDLLPQVIDRWRTSLEQAIPFDMTFPLRGADGRFRTFLTRIVPVKNDQGAVVRWFGTNTDIESQKQTEEDLKRSSRHKDEFLAMLAHELRNPLSPIRNAVHLLKFAAPSDPTLTGGAT